MSSFQLNLNPLKEPLGFIKVLEWVSAACAGEAGNRFAAPAPVPGCLPSTRCAPPSPWGPSAGPTFRVFDLSPIPAHFTLRSSLLPALRP